MFKITLKKTDAELTRRIEQRLNADWEELGAAWQPSDPTDWAVVELTNAEFDAVDEIRWEGESDGN
jgi:hypothetical protein